MLRICCPIVLGLTLIGCGKSLNQEDKTPLQAPFSDEGYASDYFLDDEECQATTGSSAVTDTATFYSFRDGAIEERPFHTKDTTSIPSLRNPTVLSTVYGFHQRTDCREYADYDDCDRKPEVISPPKNLKVCAGKSYDRNSVEGVSLTSLAHLSDARDYYVGLAGANTYIASANMLVLPKVETIRRKNGKTETKVDTDNLAYAPSFGGAPAFVIFPKGKIAEELGYWKGLSLWEIPWGMAHEYGHHVFRTHTGVKNLSPMITLPNGLEIETPLHQTTFTETTINDEHASLNLTAGNAGIAPLWNAVNEAFADLFAHYSLGQKSDLAGLDCFADNRDPTVPFFSDGTSKAITTAVMEEFIGITKTKGNGCTTPRFTDIHAIGAIIAHGTEQLLTAANIVDRAGVLIDWAERLGQRSGRLSDSSDISDLLKPMVAAVKAKSGTLAAAACLTIGDTFPKYSEKLFRAEATECLNLAN